MEERKLTKMQLIKGLGRLVLGEARKSPVTTAGLILLTACLPLVYHNRVSDAELREKVSIAADFYGNNDRATTDNEWAEVYKGLGLRYDSHNSRSLTRSQMEEYLSGHPLD